MQPIPESSDLPHYLRAVVEQLRERADRVREIAPGCVGISIASYRHGVSFTVAATDIEIAGLDAVQYLADGPCVDDAGRRGEVVAESLFDENKWRLFAVATAAQGVKSTLTLPVLNGDHEPIGTVNLYASEPTTFDGLHQEIAQIFEAWAPGAITNGDLTFSTRKVSQDAPAILQSRERDTINIAVGLLAAHDGVDLDVARQRLSEAARRGGVSDAEFAAGIIETLSQDDDEA